MWPLIGIAQVAVARWTRGPLLIVALLMLGFSLLALPPSLATDSASHAWRDDASFALGVIGWITLAAGAVLPIAGGAVTARRAEARVAGTHATTVGHLAALWLLLAVLACAGAAETSTWLRWRHGNIEAREFSIVSAPVWQNQERLECSKKKPIRIAIPVKPDATSAGSLRIATTFKVTAAEVGPAGPPTLHVRYRTNDSVWHERSVRPDGLGGLIITATCTDKTRELFVEFSEPATPATLVVAPHGFVVSGAPVRTFGALMRGALIVAAMGIGVGAFVVLMSGHVHVALAVTLGLLLAIFSATLSSHRAEGLPWLELVGGWLPGASAIDPGSALRTGFAPTWDWVAASFARAGLWTAIAVVAPQRKWMPERVA